MLSSHKPPALVGSASEVSRSKSLVASLGGAAQFLGQLLDYAAGNLTQNSKGFIFESQANLRSASIEEAYFVCSRNTIV